jgi:Family of unknown function (DUF6088)
MQAIEKSVLNRIYGHGRGWCFTPSDFLDLGSTGAVRIALLRLKRKKTIRQLANGLYDYPRRHPELGMLSPNPEAVAKALSRERNTRIQVSGAYAANLLGLSEQVPARIVFLTDGAPRRIRVGNQEIVLRRTTPRNMATAGRISGTIIQALRFIGKSQITPAHRQSLTRKLNDDEKQQLLKDRLHAPGWMRPVLDEISKARLHA